jgi:hypothetical protein
MDSNFDGVKHIVVTSRLSMGSRKTGLMLQSGLGVIDLINLDESYIILNARSTKFIVSEDFKK